MHAIAAARRHALPTGSDPERPRERSVAAAGWRVVRGGSVVRVSALPAAWVPVSALPGGSVGPRPDGHCGRGSEAPAARGSNPRRFDRCSPSGLSSAAVFRPERRREAVASPRVRRVVTSPGRRSVGPQPDGAFVTHRQPSTSRRLARMDGDATERMHPADPEPRPGGRARPPFTIAGRPRLPRQRRAPSYGGRPRAAGEASAAGDPLRGLRRLGQRLARRRVGRPVGADEAPLPPTGRLAPAARAVSSGHARTPVALQTFAGGVSTRRYLRRCTPTSTTSPKGNPERSERVDGGVRRRATRGAGEGEARAKSTRARRPLVGVSSSRAPHPPGRHRLQSLRAGR
jgi:hypothetical protein